jgi:hypothetical protein
MQRLLLTTPILIASLAWIIRQGLDRSANHRRRALPSKKKVAGSALPPVSLYTGLTGTRAGLSYVREYVKLTLRSRINYALANQWITFWNSSALLNEIARSEPSVLKKVFRPYLTNCLSSYDRLDVLTSHYTLVAQHGLGDIVLRAAKSPVQLCEFSGRSEHLYQIRLVVDNTMEREGEMVLQLVGAGSVLFSVAFTFFDHSRVPTVAIGCLQGGRDSDNQEQIRFATRDLFGLRPKTLMVRLVQHIGYELGYRDLLMVGNQNRTVHQQLRKGIVFADYDTTWIELGAECRADGDFKMACTALAEPDFLAIASNKRSEAKKRFALLSTISRLSYTGLKLS